MAVEMKDVVRSARVMTEDGEILELTAEELGFGYRRSVIPERKLIALEAELELTEGREEEIRARMEELAALDAMGVDAAILGKSLYTGALDLAECVRRYETKG